MAVILIEGFDHYDRGAGVGTVLEYERKYKGTLSSTLSVHSTTTPNNRGHSLELTANTQEFCPLVNDYYRNETSNMAVPTGCVGFHFYTTNYNSDTGVPILEIGYGDSNYPQMSIRVDGTTGKLKLYRGTTTEELGASTNTIANSTWYYIELKYGISPSISVDSNILKVDGNIWLTLVAGKNTRLQANNSLQYFRWRGANSTTRRIDNVYVCDNSGTYNKGFLNAGAGVFVITIEPTSNGSVNNFTASAGSQYQCVDEDAPDEDTTYNESSTDAHKDQFYMRSISSSGMIGTIHAINSVIYARRTTPRMSSIKHLCYVESSPTEGNFKYNALNQNYDYYQYIWEQNPMASQLWTKGDIAASEFGYKLTFTTDSGTIAV